MTRGLTDPIPEPEEKNDQDPERDQVLHDLIVSHNMLHDRLVRLEAIVDSYTHIAQTQQLTTNKPNKPIKPKWKRGL
jgi:hypothetical protein